MRKSVTFALSLALAVPAAFCQIGIGTIHNSVPSPARRQRAVGDPKAARITMHCPTPVPASSPGQGECSFCCRAESSQSGSLRDWHKTG